ncbi:MAG: BamA/TamA family outer membrane protein [Flavobacteriales bacterium]|nr:BamA/TamA family outer membrane protein [Flavobacteriales bacterium]
MVLFYLPIAAQVTADYHADQVDRFVNWERQFESIDASRAYLDDQVRQQREEGYLSFSIDSMRIDEPSVHYYIYVGQRFDLPSGLNAGHRQKLKKLDRLENNGYPFARLEINNSLDSSLLLSEAVIYPGPLVRFDSLILLQSPQLPAKVIGHHLGIRSGEIYNEELVEDADRRLRQLPFLQVVRNTSVIFSGQKARVLLGVEKRNANQVDGIVGFQPDADGKVSFTGEVQLDLQNAFSHLDAIHLRWQRVADNTQRLEFDIRYPYLFGSRLGVKAGIEQFRQDTTFNQVILNASLFTILENSSSFAAFISSRVVNDLLVSDTVPGSSTRTQQIGVDYEYNALDDRFNPRKGLFLNAGISYGDKEVQSGTGSSEQVSVDQYMAQADLGYFIPIKKRSTCLLQMTGQRMESDVIIPNELYRIGGLKSLRGFDEQSIRASSYLISTLEYRLLFDERSYLTAFVDYAWYEQDVLEGYLSDTPYGLGLGAAFGTAAGILNINYALGSQLGQAIDLQTGKIHFGYSALF